MRGLVEASKADGGDVAAEAVGRRPDGKGGRSEPTGGTGDRGNAGEHGGTSGRVASSKEQGGGVFGKPFFFPLPGLHQNQAGQGEKPFWRSQHFESAGCGPSTRGPRAV